MCIACSGHRETELLKSGFRYTRGGPSLPHGTAAEVCEPRLAAKHICLEEGPRAVWPVPCRIRQVLSLAAMVPEADEHTARSIQMHTSRFCGEGVFCLSLRLLGWSGGGGVETVGILNFLRILMRQNGNFPAYSPRCYIDQTQLIQLSSVLVAALVARGMDRKQACLE